MREKHRPMSRTSTPNFALSLSSEGVRLLHRTPDGWTFVGAVSPEAADLAGDLAALRSQALALDPDGLRTRIIIANDQIRYLTLDGAASEARVRAALDGATPYALDDLVIDHVAAGGKTHAAAVARETLEEAEAFAVEHKFAPVAFAAAPPKGSYAGEAYFGPTRAAPALLGEGATTGREARPVVEIAPESGQVDERAKGGAAEGPTDSVGDTVATPPRAAPTPEAPAATGPERSAASGKPSPAELVPADEKPVDVRPAEGTPAKVPPTDAMQTDAIPADPTPGPVDPAMPPEAADPATPGDARQDGAPAPARVDAPEAVALSAHGAPGPDTRPDGVPAPLFASRLRAQVEDRAARLTNGSGAMAATPHDGPAVSDRRDSTASRSASERTFAPTSASSATGPDGMPERAGGATPERAGGATPERAGGATPERAGGATPERAGGAAVAGPRAPSAPTLDRVDAGRRSVPPRLPPGMPPPAVAERLAAIAGRGVPGPASDMEDDGEGDGADDVTMPLPAARRDATHPPRPLAGGTDDLPPRRTPPGLGKGADAAPPGRVLVGASPDGTAAGITAPPEALAATLRQDTPAPSPGDSPRGGLGGLFTSRRRAPARAEPSVSRTADAPPPPSGRPLSGPPAKAPPPARGSAPVPQPRTERESMTVFGARKESTAAVPRRGSRFMLLILVVVLLVLMAAVAAWAAIFPESRVAGLFGRQGAPEATVAAAPGVPAAPAVSAAPITATEVLPETAPEVPDSTAALAAPGTESAPALPGAEVATAGTGAPALPGMIAPDARPAAQSDPDPPAASLPPETAGAAVVPAPGAETGAIPTPEEADRFYAATGVWLRAPRLPLRPEPEVLTDVGLAVSATAVPAATAAPELPPLAPDGALAPQLDPPAADVTFPRDARGLLLATPGGIVTPDGMAIYAGAPPALPPTRPGTEVPVAAPVPDATGFANALSDPPGRPAARPASFADLFGPLPASALVDPDVPAPTDPTGDPTPDPTGDPTDDPATDPATDIALQSPATLPGGVSLDGLRPPQRPDGLADSAAATAEVAGAPVLVSFAGPRPPERPAGLAPLDPPAEEVADPATEETVEDVTPNTVTSALAAIVAAGRDPLANATRLAVSRAPRPDTRPRNFAQVVAAAQARTQAPAPAAAAAPAPAPAVAAAAPTVNAGGIPRAAEDDGEPEPASGAAAAPSGQTTTTVAAAATQESVIDLGRVNLIGVYGRPNNRSALIRLANGRYVRVGIGDSLEGGQVTAIGDNALNYVVRGQLYALVIPEE